MTIELDPSNEFELALITIVQMHRKKAAIYGTDEDHMQNFIDGGWMTNQTPLAYGEALMAKHQAAIRIWFQRNVKSNKSTDDAFLDRAVYGVLQLINYRRQR